MPNTWSKLHKRYNELAQYDRLLLACGLLIYIGCVFILLFHGSLLWTTVSVLLVTITVICVERFAKRRYPPDKHHSHLSITYSLMMMVLYGLMSIFTNAMLFSNNLVGTGFFSVFTQIFAYLFLLVFCVVACSLVFTDILHFSDTHDS